MVSWREKKFYKDGEELKIHCGSMHYFRIFPEQWYDRLLKLKCMGLNTVETYCCWNMHEPEEGKFCFDGMLDIEKFILTAEELGLYVIVRPGPYICAEWEFGGLPGWLLQKDNVHFRSLDPYFMSKVENYMKELLKRIVPHLESKGGKVIMMAVENEYGSFGNSTEYKIWCRDLLIKNGVDCMLFTTDGNNSTFVSGGSIEGLVSGMNFGYTKKIEEEHFVAADNHISDAPRFHTEHWIGGVSRWGEPVSKYASEFVAEEVKQHLEKNINFCLYMFCGGTNWAFYNGANGIQLPDDISKEKYSPDITSYDYDAILTEWGKCTEKYFAIQRVMEDYYGKTLPEPPKTETQTIGTVKLEQKASLFDNLDNIAGHFKEDIPYNMEHYGQSLGYILYRCEIKRNNMHYLVLREVNDRCNIFFNGIHRATIERNENKKIVDVKDWIYTGGVLEILVENQGRVNFGPDMLRGERKGICDCVFLWSKFNPRQIICNWDIFTLPMSDLDSLNYSGGERIPAFFKGTFKAEEKKDCFIHLNNFTKGFVTVNGFNLGRFWNIGPQLSLYLPAPLLKSNNEIVVFEEEAVKVPEVEILDYHILDGTKAKEAETIF